MLRNQRQIDYLQERLGYSFRVQFTDEKGETVQEKKRKRKREQQDKIDQIYPELKEISIQIEQLKSKMIELQKQRTDTMASLVEALDEDTSFEFEGRMYYIVEKTTSRSVDGELLYNKWKKRIADSRKWDSFDHDAFAKCKKDATHVTTETVVVTIEDNEDTSSHDE